MAGDNAIQRFEKRRTALRGQFDEMLPELRELQDNFCPRLNPYLMETGKNASKRVRRNRKIINTHPVTAARTWRRGMTAGIASPARPWFRLRAPDKALNEFKPVKLWLHTVQEILEDLFARSNFYNVIGVGYGEQGVFGTMAFGMFEDLIDDLRCVPYTIGSYLIAPNPEGRINTFYRAYRPTAEQIVEQFGMRNEYGQPIPKIDWSRISPEVKTAYDNESGRYTEFDVVQVITPNLERKGDYVDARNMAIKSCYYEPLQAAKGIYLKESGYEENPILVGRHDVVGEDAWGSGPGLEALGDAKALQYKEKQKDKKLDKHNDPALAASPGLKHKRVSLLSGDITFADFVTPGGQPVVRPIHEVDGNISPITLDIQEIERRISRVWDEDLFLQLSMSDAKDVTAEAIARKYEEKVVMLGPVLERQNDEVFDPAIDRAFAVAQRRGLLPPPPEELEGSKLKVEYVSVLAQAQRLIGANSIERFVAFVGAVAKAQAGAGEPPDALDKIDTDQTIDEFGVATGVVPTVIRSDDEVAELREARAAQMRAQQLAAAAKPAADAAKAVKDLSESQVNGRSVLEQMTQQ